MSSLGTAGSSSFSKGVTPECFHDAQFPEELSGAGKRVESSTIITRLNFFHRQSSNNEPRSDSRRSSPHTGCVFIKRSRTPPPALAPATDAGDVVPRRRMMVPRPGDGDKGPVANDQREKESRILRGMRRHSPDAATNQTDPAATSLSSGEQHAISHQHSHDNRERSVIRSIIPLIGGLGHKAERILAGRQASSRSLPPEEHGKERSELYAKTRRQRRKSADSGIPDANLKTVRQKRASNSKQEATFYRGLSTIPTRPRPPFHAVKCENVRTHRNANDTALFLYEFLDEKGQVPVRGVRGENRSPRRQETHRRTKAPANRPLDHVDGAHLTRSLLEEIPQGLTLSNASRSSSRKQKAGSHCRPVFPGDSTNQADPRAGSLLVTSKNKQEFNREWVAGTTGRPIQIRLPSRGSDLSMLAYKRAVFQELSMGTGDTFLWDDQRY